jgi:hypothetical protein
MTKYLKHKAGSVEEAIAKQQPVIDSDYQAKFNEAIKEAGKGIGSMTPKEKSDFYSKMEELKEVKYTIGYEIDSDDRNDKKYKGEDEMSVNASSSRDAAKKFGQEMNKLVKKAGQRSKSILKIGMTSFEDNNRDYNESEINKLDDYANDFIYKGIYDSYLIKPTKEGLETMIPNKKDDVKDLKRKVTMTGEKPTKVDMEPEVKMDTQKPYSGKTNK